MMQKALQIDRSHRFSDDLLIRLALREPTAAILRLILAVPAMARFVQQMDDPGVLLLDCLSAYTHPSVECLAEVLEIPCVISAMARDEQRLEEHLLSFTKRHEFSHMPASDPVSECLRLILQHEQLVAGLPPTTRIKVASFAWDTVPEQLLRVMDSLDQPLASEALDLCLRKHAWASALLARGATYRCRDSNLEDFWSYRVTGSFATMASRTIITVLCCAKRTGLHLPPELWEHVFSFMRCYDFLEPSDFDYFDDFHDGDYDDYDHYDDYYDDHGNHYGDDFYGDFARFYAHDYYDVYDDDFDDYY
eukprot:m.266357 g.266357  ORF g.266357 m.266357 type:complete len:306 (+) comp11065_c0_seq29:3158-4075(+)